MIEVDEDFWVRLNRVSAFMWNGPQNLTIWLPHGPLNVTGERASDLWSILVRDAES